LGTLLDRLSAAHDELGDLLIAAVDTRLRNAEAHEDYRVASDGTITFIADAATLDIDTLSERTETLSTAVAGMQAGLLCFAVDHQLLDSAPAWLPRGDLVARSILAALGGDVSFLTIGPTVEIGFSDIPDSPLELLTLLVALVPILNEADEFRVYDSAGGVALICPAAPLQAFATADDDIRDLATIAANYAAAVATGADPNSTFVDAFSAMLMMVTAGIGADIEELEPRSVFRRAELRLAHVRQFATEHRATEERSTAAALAAVAAAERATKPAARGNRLALRQLASQLGHLEEWVATHRVQWPPEWLATAQRGPAEAS
jgi:hypothetical protein